MSEHIRCTECDYKRGDVGNVHRGGVCCGFDSRELYATMRTQLPRFREPSYSDRLSAQLRRAHAEGDRVTVLAVFNRLRIATFAAPSMAGYYSRALESIASVRDVLTWARENRLMNCADLWNGRFDHV